MQGPHCWGARAVLLCELCSSWQKTKGLISDGELQHAAGPGLGDALEEDYSKFELNCHTERSLGFLSKGSGEE